MPQSSKYATAENQSARSFTVLYRTERLAMVRLAAFLVDDRDVAEDVVQDAFTGLHAHWHRLRDEEAAMGYLRRSVVNRSRSVLRHRGIVRRFVWPVPVPAPAADANIVIDDEHRRIRRALTRIPQRQREVLLLRYWAELSEAQIAATLGISAGTVKSAASRGLRSLENALDHPETHLTRRSHP